MNKTITYTMGKHPDFDREVYFLKFAYSEELKELVKYTINELRYQYTSRTFYPRHQAGNWLNSKAYRCWFVSPEIWQSFKDNLEYEGYSFHYHSEENTDEDHNYQRNKQSQTDTTAPAKFNLFTTWLNIRPENEIALHAAYKNLVQLLHPDRQSNERLRQMAETLMKLINDHYDTFRKAKVS
jgi:hypothetical protein